MDRVFLAFACKKTIHNDVHLILGVCLGPKHVYFYDNTDVVELNKTTANEPENNKPQTDGNSLLCS